MAGKDVLLPVSAVAAGAAAAGKGEQFILRLAEANSDGVVLPVVRTSVVAENVAAADAGKPDPVPAAGSGSRVT